MPNKQYEAHEHSNEWKQKYRAQVEDARRDGRIYGLALARRHLRDVLCVRDIEEAVADALGDIWSGTISWNPDAVGLPRAVQDVLMFRVPRAIKRALTHEPIFVENEEQSELRVDEEPLRLLADVAGEDERERFVLRDLARRVIDELQSRMRGDAYDPEVSALLEALCEGVSDRSALAARAGVAELHLHNVERRLAYLAASLPRSLCPDSAVVAVTRARRAPKRCLRATDRLHVRRDVLDLAQLLGLIA